MRDVNMRWILFRREYFVSSFGVSAGDGFPWKLMASIVFVLLRLTRIFLPPLSRPSQLYKTVAACCGPLNSDHRPKEAVAGHAWYAWL